MLFMPWLTRRAYRALGALCSLLAAWHSISGLGAQTARLAAPSAERLFSESPAVFFEEYPTWARVSPDGRWAIYSGWTGVRILDLAGKRAAPERIWPGVSDIHSAAWGPGGMLVLYGSRNGKRGWYQS